MKKRIILILLFAVITNIAFANEGMWLPLLIKERIIDMKKNGSKLSASDIYDVNKASLKDAIVQFGGGCTGEIISDKGLLITNHHCGFSQIQSHSSVDHDYLKDGFMAKSMSDELPNRGLSVKFLVRMEDVTSKVLTGYNTSMNEDERLALIGKNSREVINDMTKGTNLSASVESFYYGNQYFVFLYKIYKDVRLVAAPPSSIGKFGGDTDNWIWPRHTGDFSIFRIYSDKNNEPADYSPENVPFKPKKSLKISLNGVKDGDFTMVYGYPGRTQQYLYSGAVKYIIEKGNPHKINLRTLRLGVQTRDMSLSQEVRIKYASKNANVANSWKKWQGEKMGLENADAVNKKIEYEKRFSEWSSSKPEYSKLLTEMNSVYTEMEPYTFVNDYVSEAINVNEITRFAGTFYGTILRNSSNEATLNKALQNAASDFYKDYYLPIDMDSFILLLNEYDKNIDEQYKPAWFINMKIKYRNIEGIAGYIFTRSIFADSAKLYSAIKNGNIKTVVETDPAYIFNSEFNRDFNERIRPKLNYYNQKLNILYRDYMRAQMEFENKVFYPDANSTLRVAYGKVKGYSPKDAVSYKYYSTIEGIMEKDNPEIYDYDIPQKLREVYAIKDFGRWTVNGTVPVCFIATNHTSGGNSGSPVLDANGNLVGINFDRVWEGTMSDVLFNPEICRNIALDIRYVMFTLEKVMGGSRLIEEMKFVVK